MKHYSLYYCAGVEVQFDANTNEPIRATKDYKLSAYNNFLATLFTTGIYVSLFGPSKYEPFYSEVDVINCSFSEMFRGIAHVDMDLIRNNLTQTILLQLYLTTFSSGLVVIVVTLFGVKTNIPMRNPVFESTSPSDFWGRR